MAFFHIYKNINRTLTLVSHHLHVVLVSFSCFVNIEIIFEEAGLRMNDAIEEFLAWCVHQNDTSLHPFGFGISFCLKEFTKIGKI